MSCCWGSCFVCLGVAFLLSGACVIALREGASGCSAGSRRHSADPPRTIRRNWAIFGHWVCTMAVSRRDERYLCIGRHKVEMRAVQHHGALADTPLAMRFSPLNTHANPLYGTWASLSARGPAIPSLGNPAHVRDRRPTCGTGGPRAEQAAHVQDALVSRVANPQRIIGQQRQPNPTTRAHHHTDPCYTHPREQPIAQMRRLPTQGINNIFLALNGVRH